MQAGTIVGSGSFVPDYVPPDHATGLTPNATPYWMTGGSGAEVEVDTETGHVRVLRLVNVADAGTPINPRIVETQLTGAAVMQLGFTLSEQMVFTNGQLRNPSFADYKIPGIRDMPEFLTGESVAARQDPDPTVRRASAKPARSACRRRSPTRFTTRSACASRNCRSPPRRSTARPISHWPAGSSVHPTRRARRAAAPMVVTKAKSGALVPAAAGV